MEPLLAALQASDLATALRFSRWSYAAVNTAHLLGIALLIGAITPLDLRLLGGWPTIDRKALARILIPIAAFGLTLAIVAGLLLFAIRAVDYAALVVFRIKLLLIIAGVISALMLHLTHGLVLETANPGRLRLAAILSLVSWLGALVAGRLIAFVGN